MAGKPRRMRGKWQIRWTDHTGKRRSEVYARYRDAERALREHQHHDDAVRAGTRPAPAVPRTLDELCSEWLEVRASTKRSRKTDESFIRAHLRPAFGKTLISEIGVREVARYAADRRHLSDNTIAHHLTLLISMLRHAVEIEWLESVPRIKKPRVRHVSPDFRYLRDDAEVRAFLAAARDHSPELETLYSTAVFTGLRAGELAGLRWGDVGIKRRLITVRRSYAGPTKNGLTRYVPILDPLLPCLSAWRLRASKGSELVFPNRAGKMRQKSDRVFQEKLHAVLEGAHLPKRYITFHGLRHTFASHWMMNGGSLFKLQKILGHQSIAMTERYSHLAPGAFEEDHGRLSDLARPNGRIIPMSQAEPVERTPSDGALSNGAK